jgi:hypothetical protein
VVHRVRVFERTVFVDTVNPYSIRMVLKKSWPGNKVVVMGSAAGFSDTAFT